MKNQPEAPEAPDYAEANKAGVQADIDALPLRNAINAATQLGGKYTDPNTGKTYDFTGLGNADVNQKLFMQQLENAPTAADALLQIQNQYGPQFAQAARNSLQVTDPEGFALRQQFGNRLLNGDGTMEDLAGGLPMVPDYEKVTSSPEYSKYQDSQSTSALRGLAEGDANDQLSSIGVLDPALQRAAEQGARARGSANGNILGDSSALSEALAVQLAQQQSDQQKRANGIGFLQSGQTQSDSDYKTAGFNNSVAAQSFNDVMNSINQRNQASSQKFANQSQNVQSRQNARQQDLANVQSFLGLQPIVSQGAQLAGLQQGAAPTSYGTGYGAVGTAQNAGQLGTGFASNIFGTQANIFGTQSQAATAANGQMLSAATSFACHVAREVYGAENPEWLKFYFWKETMAPVIFREIYNAFSVEIANFIKPFPAIKNLVRRWMDSKIKSL